MGQGLNQKNDFTIFFSLSGEKYRRKKNMMQIMPNADFMNKMMIMMMANMMKKKMD